MSLKCKPWPLAALPLAALLVLLPTPGHALTTLCSGIWAGTGANQPATETFTSATPCPTPALTASLEHIGSGTNVTGDSFSNNYKAFPFASTVELTSSTAIRIGSGNKTITFGRAVTDPYLLFNLLPNSISYTFTPSFDVVGIARATRSGQTITAANNAGGFSSSGFIVKLIGTFTSAAFSITGGSSPVTGFTAAAAPSSIAPAPAPIAVPGPLPILGAAAAWRASRKLRRRCSLAAKQGLTQAAPRAPVRSLNRHI